MNRQTLGMVFPFTVLTCSILISTAYTRTWGVPPASIQADSESMLHSPIPVYNRDIVTTDLVKTTVKPDETVIVGYGPGDRSPLWGRQSPKIVRVGNYYYSVISSALFDVTRPLGGGVQYHRDVTLYQREKDSDIWVQVWTEDFLEPAAPVGDAGLGSRRGLQAASIVVDGSSSRRLHIVFTGLDGLATAVPEYPLRHYTFLLNNDSADTEWGDLLTGTPASDGPSESHMANRGIQIARWGMGANTTNQYLYLIGTEYGKDFRDSTQCSGNFRMPRESVLRVLRFNPASQAWTIVKHEFVDGNTMVEYDPRNPYAGGLAGGYLGPNATLGYTVVEAEGPRVWSLSQVIGWNSPKECPNTENPPTVDMAGNYTEPVRLIHMTNAGKTFQYDIPLPPFDYDAQNNPLNVEYAVDLAAVSFSDSGVTKYRIFALCVDKETAKNYVYVYEQELGTNKIPFTVPTMVLQGSFLVPKLVGDNASIHYDKISDRLYIVGRRSSKSVPTGHGDQETGVWVTSNDPNCWDTVNPPVWEWDGVLLDPPSFVSSWPFRKNEYTQALSRRSGGDLPADGLHIIQTYRLDDWITTFNTISSGNSSGLFDGYPDESEAMDPSLYMPGQLMLPARGVWDMHLNILGMSASQCP